jgi:hypothetical protein
MFSYFIDCLASDNCAGSLTGKHNATLPILAQGTIVVTWTYSDGKGNTTIQTQNVVINDAAAPLANSASLSTINSVCQIVSLTAPAAKDNCSGAIVGTHNVSLPITSNTTITWTYDDGNAAISGATSQIFVPIVAGNYACEIDNGNCTVTTACLSSSLGIVENSFGSSIVLYPNPTFGNLEVGLGEVYNDVTVKMFNALGQGVINENFGSTNEINLNIEGTPGMYILEIRTEEGKAASVNVIKE